MPSPLLQTLQARGAPTVAQSNQTFMQNNPQYGSMGTKTANPQANIKQPPNTTPQPVKTPPKAPVTTGSTGNTPPNTGGNTPSTGQTASAGNTGYLGGANALNPSASVFGALYGAGTGTDPDVEAAKTELQRYKDAYANAQAGIAQGGQDFGYTQGLEQNASNQYQLGLGSRQTALSNALTAQSQRLGALGTASGIAQPTQVSPGNFFVSPLTGQDVSGGSISPGLGGQRQQEVTQGNNYQANLPKLSSAAGAVNDFNSVLSRSGLQQSDLNVGNFINNLIAGNTSNPYYPQLYSLFNNAINFYAQILGQDPQNLITTLSSTAKGQTLSQMFQSLDKSARDYNNNLLTNSRGGSTTTTVQPTVTPSGGQVHEGDTHSFNGTNYKVVNGQWVKQ